MDDDQNPTLGFNSIHHEIILLRNLYDIYTDVWLRKTEGRFS